VVSNSGGLDGSLAFYYDRGWRLLEIRDGSANVVAQVYGGTQYIDEVVAERSEDGYMVVNQDANWNVTSATDLAGRVLERTFFWHRLPSPTFTSQTIFGEYGERSKPTYHQVLRVGPGFLGLYANGVASYSPGLPALAGYPG